MAVKRLHVGSFLMPPCWCEFHRLQEVINAMMKNLVVEQIVMAEKRKQSQKY